MHVVILAWLLSTAAAAPSPCESEMNKVKDLLQVSCEDQGLTALPAGLPPDTGLLLLASNHLRRFSLAALRPFDRLAELDLSNNSLAALETQAEAPLPALQALFLSHNALGSLPALLGLPALTLLALGHNGLERLPEGGFRGVGGLQELQLQGNRLRSLPTEVFRGLSLLKDLDLSDNELDALPAELLSGLGALEILRLERNRLRTIPEGFFPEENTFGYVYLAGNPWRCDCGLAYLREWLNENEFAVYTRTQVGQKEVTENEPQSVRCQAPAGEKGTPVMRFRAQCRTLGDSDEDGEDGGEDEGQPSSPLATTPSSTTATPGSTSASSPGTTTGPLTTDAPTTPRSVPPAPTAHCFCPVTAHHRSPLRRQRRPLTWGGWLSRHCCPLRLALYVACLALVAVPSLALLCGLCCGHHPQQSAPLRPPEAHLLRYRPLRAEKEPQEPWVSGGSLSGRRTFRVCKTFPVGHVSWLLVSLPAKPARPERPQREGRVSCYSVGRGGDVLGAVRVRYATASL